MTRFVNCRSVVLAAVLGFSAALCVSAATAQDAKAKAPAKADTAKADAGKAAPAKVKKPRLPTYYAQIVDDAQREKIAAMQGKYADRKEALKKQLAELEVQEDAEIESVLTPDQKTKLAAIKEEAKAKKAAKKDADKKPAGKAEKKAA